MYKKRLILIKINSQHGIHGNHMGHLYNTPNVIMIPYNSNSWLQSSIARVKPKLRPSRSIFNADTDTDAAFLLRQVIASLNCLSFTVYSLICIYG